MRYRWAILAVGVVAQGALAALQQGLPALGPALREEFGLSLTEVGLVLTSAAWGVMLTLLAWGWLADQIGERLVISSGLAGGALALVGAAQVDGVGALIGMLALAGALSASAAAASGRAVIGWFARTERGLALGIRQMSVPLGGAVAALSLPLLVSLGGLQAAFLGLAAAAALAALAAALWIREPPPPPANRPVIDSPPPLRDGRVWRLSIGSALLVCAQVSITSFAVLFLHDHRGVAAGAAAGALAAIQVGGALARLVAGRRSDLAGRRIAPMKRIALATAFAVVGIAAAVDAPLPVLLTVLIAAGMLAMSWNGLSFTAAAEIAGRDRAGTAMGLQQTVMRGLSAGTGVGFGALVAATSWPVGFALLAALPLAGWWVLRPLEGEEEDRILARERRLAAAA